MTINVVCIWLLNLDTSGLITRVLDTTDDEGRVRGVIEDFEVLGNLFNVLGVIEHFEMLGINYSR